MSMNRRLLPAALAFAGLLGATAAWAQSETLPSVTTQGLISYISGGVGSDEAAALRRAAPSYPLTLELAVPSGGPRDAYIADAKVEIRDQQGHTMLSTQSEGPLFLVRVPSGQYTVEVAWNGSVRRKTVDVTAGKPQHVFFEFRNAG